MVTTRLRRLPPVAGSVVGALVLGLATWLALGYRYEVWPQPGLLMSVLRLDGRLEGDWAAAAPAVHWFMANALGALPHGALATAVAALFAVQLVALWAGWMLAARALGLGALTAVAAGLVAIPTGLSGVGASTLLVGYFYPSALAFGLVMLALGLVLGGTRAWPSAGAALGLAILVHPGVGVLFAAAIVPAALVASRAVRDLVRLLVPLAVLGAPAVVQAAAGQALGSGLSAQARYDLLAVVRAPHHFLYSAFTMPDWVALVGWAAVLCAGAAWLRRTVPVRIVTVAAAAATVLLAAGAAASVAEAPLALVQLQTARVSPLLVVAGILLGAALLERLAGPLAAGLLLAVYALATVLDVPLRQQVAAHAPGLSSAVTGSSVEALLLLVCCIAAVVLARRAPEATWRPAWASRAVALAGLAALLALADGRSSLVLSSPQDDALRAVGAAVRELTPPTGVVLVPPDADSFTTLARRPTVVTFGSFPYGERDREWIERLADVTGRPQVTARDPLGANVAERLRLADAGYAGRLGSSSPVLACRYRARAAVAYRGTRLGPWLESVYRNRVYVLALVRPGACR